MSAKNAKLVRSQLRDIIKEMLPELLTQEIFKSIMTNNQIAMKSIRENVEKQLKQMDERQKDTLHYLVKQATITKG